jgi:hypothetical protein
MLNATAGGTSTPPQVVHLLSGMRRVIEPLVAPQHVQRFFIDLLTDGVGEVLRGRVLVVVLLLQQFVSQRANLLKDGGKGAFAVGVPTAAARVDHNSPAFAQQQRFSYR